MIDQNFFNFDGHNLGTFEVFNANKELTLDQLTPCFYWCLGPDLNRHGGGPPRDFKSLASTNSATQAYFSFSVIRDACLV